MRHGGKAPGANADGKRRPKTDPIHKPTCAKEAEGGRHLEHRRHLPVGVVGPPQIGLQQRLHQGDQLPIRTVQETGGHQEDHDRRLAIPVKARRHC
jgi:hypothetical protein